MYRKSFHNHNNHSSGNGFKRRRFHGSNRNRQSGRGAPKKFVPQMTNAVTRGSAEYVEPPAIINKFSDFKVPENLLKNIYARGYSIPTPIQDKAIIPALEGRDLIGIAETGSGKTAAFLIPIINKLMHSRTEKALIIVPTRELAVQINDEFRLLSKFLYVMSVLCIGGTSINRQIFDLRKNPQIIIGTPGRIKDLYKRSFLHLKTFGTVVLDEADRMVDIGFLPEIKFIVSALREDRQSLFFSATLTPDVEGILHSFVADPVKVSVKENKAPVSIQQDIIRVKNQDDKLNKLQELLKREEFKKVLIFGRTKHGVDRLSQRLSLMGFPVDSIHGNKSQNKRLRVLSDFRENRLKILIATDIAARGLDIPEVTHVINFDEPASQIDYIHRIGRTGRANREGSALTFVG